jgi:hypothetical protein
MMPQSFLNFLLDAHGGLHPAPPLPDAPTGSEIVLVNVDEALRRTLRGEFEDGALQLALLFAAQQQLL